MLSAKMGNLLFILNGDFGLNNKVTFIILFK